MKIKLLWLCIIAFCFLSCDKQEVVDDVNTEASLSIKFKSTSLRSEDTSSELAKDDVIKQLDLFIYDGNEDFVSHNRMNFDVNTSYEITNIKLSTGEYSLVAVANSSIEFNDSIGKEALLEIVTTDLSSQYGEGGLLMTSEPHKIEVKAGNNYYGYSKDDVIGTNLSEKPILLTRVVAKIVLNEITTNISSSKGNLTFVPEEAFVFNVRRESKLFGKSLIHGDTFLSGIDLSNFSGDLKQEKEYYVDSCLLYDYSDEEKNTPTFYVFESYAETSTVLSIKGKLETSQNDSLTEADFPGSIDGEGYTYYSIIINGNREGYSYSDDDYTADGTITRNRIYNLKLNINQSGKVDPTSLLASGSAIDVMFDVVDWTKIDQEIDY